MSVEHTIHIGKTVPILPGLYLVSTPIGNLRDITLRAIDTLAAVDVVYCEDTRIGGKLMKAAGLQKPLKAYHDHSHDSDRARIIERIKNGEKIALISDAGTPLISDPGYKLVRDCAKEDILVTTLPGANAVLSGLQLSALPSDVFTFHGFLPSKTQARQNYLQRWADVRTTHVFYESGARLDKSLTDVRAVFGDRECAVAREITKKFEEVKRGKVSDILRDFEKPKGEIVLVVGQPEDKDVAQDDVDEMLRTALQTMRVKDAAAHVAQICAKPKKEIYARALEFKKSD